MTPELMNYLCEPITKAPLKLTITSSDSERNIKSGYLVSPSGNRYPIVNGIPRFVGFVPARTVKSFGDEWNYFNFTDFKSNWLSHTVKNTFGTINAFKGKVIVDAGGGSGAQTKWFSEFGAKHVILMDLSHSVDDVVQRNIGGLKNVDVIQCSIDAPPLRDRSVDGIVYCHNVIQHTPSVEKTAQALYTVVAPGGEFVFNCYSLNDQGVLRWVRFHIIYKSLRAILSRMPFGLILVYSWVMAALRLIPLMGILLEKSGFCSLGYVTRKSNESLWAYLKRKFRNTSLNTFDGFGSHKYQHHKSEVEIRALLKTLQPDETKILNIVNYFKRPAPPGCALRVFR